jgi:hypothetical protein
MLSANTSEKANSLWRLTNNLRLDEPWAPSQPAFCLRSAASVHMTKLVITSDQCSVSIQEGI